MPEFKLRTEIRLKGLTKLLLRTAVRSAGHPGWQRAAPGVGKPHRHQFCRLWMTRRISMNALALGCVLTGLAPASPEPAIASNASFVALFAALSPPVKPVGPERLMALMKKLEEPTRLRSDG